ncbi:aminotransferase class I/II-fold pyridoxal phosphate-dependent enzyme [Vibrio ostreicida]|uniref:Aminotransferase class I/II-fold pyridoxal phosphate-dependent enzyme n=1 Tax=Vibrio ostreicida TaxID=526588 RepID=A0ABT8C1X6_9VIBR|nr:aminotransferase class I/II-fold pyridoxal phosphate-dependent enzyme [Vibrio ostreicida]MDN3612353.1 aminotransferase class I/II-fold pyridoxal phosphate-dependent enzyme [Vibrio ostreicida]NPD09876.1 aminotransferase class I/II-fold pyridoxal phosphate-dependent enzyme [Vibrio ostreicida]
MEKRLNDFYLYAKDMVNNNIAHLDLDDIFDDGKYLSLDGHKMRNYGSCSYLCVENDVRLKYAAIEEIERTGTQLSASRAYMSHPLYKTLETKLDRLFGGHVLLTSTTTLGHMSALPVLVEKGDLLIVDQQAHSSIQLSAKVVAASGAEVRIIKHNDVQAVESLLKEGQHYRKIWFATDGVFSMYGDLAPLDELRTMLTQYDNFWLYIDDAHGAGWRGKHGKGYVLGEHDLDEKSVVAISFSKCFGVAGGGIVLPNKELYELVRYCGPAFSFGGPLQPANLAALNASLDLFMSEELETLQTQLFDLINYFNQKVSDHGLPLIAETSSPIRFIAIGNELVTRDVINDLMRKGIYVNIGAFPAVGKGKSGLRIALNISHTNDDIDALCNHICDSLKLRLTKESEQLGAGYTEHVLLPAFAKEISQKSAINKILNASWSQTSLEENR